MKGQGDRAWLSLAISPKLWRTWIKSSWSPELSALSQRKTYEHWNIEGYQLFVWEHATSDEIETLRQLAYFSASDAKHYKLCFIELEARENEILQEFQLGDLDKFMLHLFGAWFHYEHPVAGHGSVKEEDKHIEELPAFYRVGVWK